MPRRSHSGLRCWPAWLALMALPCVLVASLAAAPASADTDKALRLAYRLDTLERAVLDLAGTGGPDYPDAPSFLQRGQALRSRLAKIAPGSRDDLLALDAAITRLQQDALLTNPILRSNRLLLIKHRPVKRPGGSPGFDIAMPSNHECNSSLPRLDHDNALCVLERLHPDAPLRTLHRPPPAPDRTSCSPLQSTRT